MEKTITDSQTTSKNAFEKFYELIERLRLKSTDGKYTSSLNLLENIILLQERILQDLNDSELTKKQIESVNILVNEFLDEFCEVVLNLPSDTSLLDSISYNIFASNSILKHINSNNFDMFIRHFTKLFISRKTYFVVKNNENYTFALRSISSDPNLSPVSRDLEKARADLIKMWTFHRNTGDLIKEMTDSFINRLVGDYFKIGQLNDFKDYSIEELNEHISKFDISKKIEFLFELTEKEYYVWDIELKLNHSYYSATKISYLIYSLTTAIESLGDIKVEISDWGRGSRWVNLKVIIKDAASKLDLVQLMKKVRQGIESAIHKKTYGDVKKIEAEADKLIRETENLPNKEQSKTIHELEIQERILNLESKKEDIRAKKIDNLTKLSKLAQDGILENDGDLQVYINSCLFINITEGSYDPTKNKELSEIEGKESTEKEGDKNDIPNV